MWNFGVFEVLNVKTVPAPGWAYVPDNGPQTPLSATQPILSRKRARNLTLLPGEISTTAQQDAKLLRELSLLDRENHRDVTIPIPLKQNSEQATGRGKLTPAVRKIFQSNKTFANYLADSEAIQASSGASSFSQTPTTKRRITSKTGTTAISNNNTLHRKNKRKAIIGNIKTTRATVSRNHSASSTALVDSPTEIGSSGQDKMGALISEEIKPQPRLILSPGIVTQPIFHPRDYDPLLMSRVPVMPSEEELENLLTRPPLSYLEARGPWVEEDRRKPPRHFCERCGDWAKVKCVKCGGRVCSLTCFNKHKEECSKYGS